MSVDPSKPFSEALVLQDIQRRLESLERATRITNSSANGASVPNVESVASDVYGNLVTVGPTCTVNVPVSGRVFVLASAGTTIWLPPGSGVNLGIAYVSVALTGTNTFTPVRTTPGHDSTAMIQRDNTTPEAQLATVIVHGRLMENLTPGPTTFTMKYARVSDEPLAASISFDNRALVVIPL